MALVSTNRKYLTWAIVGAVLYLCASCSPAPKQAAAIATRAYQSGGEYERAELRLRNPRMTFEEVMK